MICQTYCIEHLLYRRICNSETFPAYLISKTDSGQLAELKAISLDDLMDGDVTVKVDYSALNYKDGLALTGKVPVVRRFPLLPGIDFAGRVVSSTHGRFKEGDQVVLNGFGVGSVAVSLLSHLGYRVIGATGRVAERDYLINLGAKDIIRSK